MPSGGSRRAPRRRRRVSWLGRSGLVVAILAGLVVLGGSLWSTRELIVEETGPPTALAAEPLSPTSVELEWKPAEDVDRYVVRVGPERSLTRGAVEVETRTPKATLEDLAATTPGTDRYFRVDAVRGAEVSSSRTGRFALPPAAMSVVKVAKTSSSGTRLTWKAVPNARQYDVEASRKKDFTGRTALVRTVGSKPELITKELDPRTTYWFRVRPVNGSLVGDFGKAVTTRTRSEQVAFNVGAWNVCSEKCSGYPSRARSMAAFLNAEELDVFALQEAGGKRVGPTTAAIFSGGERGFRLATGGAKARYIFYRPALFEQEGGGFFPVGDGRYATWAQFTVKGTGKQFIVVSVHLENGKSSGDDAKRAAETRTMLGRMAAINTGDVPIVYAGDFNSGRHRAADSPGTLMRGAGMVDTVDAVTDPVNRQFNTGHTFSTRPLLSGAHVDHIFASKGLDVLAWEQLVRMNGSSYASPDLSDHNALRARLALEAKDVKIGAPTRVVQVPLGEPTTAPGAAP